MSKDQKRGPGARKVELERRLDANAEVERRDFDRNAGLRRTSANDDHHDRPQGVWHDGDGADFATPAQQATGRGHKAQQSAPHRAGRPSGGNIRNEER